MKEKPKNYVSPNQLTYEVILSQGKGYMTKKLEHMFMLIIKNLHNKMGKNYSYDLRLDAYQDAFYKLATTYKKYDFKRYPDSCFSYFTELIKRCAVESLNSEIYRTHQSNGIKGSFISYSAFETLNF